MSLAQGKVDRRNLVKIMIEQCVFFLINVFPLKDPERYFV